MPRRPIAAASLALTLLAACGGKEQPGPPPAVTCWNATDVNSGVLTVGAQATCGTASGYPGNSYTFVSGPASATYSVTLWTTNGDADLHVYAGPTLVGSSINTPPIWVDKVTFRAAASTTYTVLVEDANYYGVSSSYAVQVTSP